MMMSSEAEDRAIPANEDRRLDGDALNLVRDLVDEFRKAGVEFCHWKSNAAIALSEAGINDLDLMINEEDGPPARRVLHSLGFVRAIVPRSRRVPNLTDYFGLDLDSGRLVQVQLHDKLILGDDMTKSFRLPVESVFLASARTESMLSVPAPEMGRRRRFVRREDTRSGVPRGDQRDLALPLRQTARVG